MDIEKQSNLYDLLEVSPRARPEIIKAAYRIIIKDKHPDKPNGNEFVASGLNRAAEILLNQEKREEYDESRNNLVGKTIGNYRILELIAEGEFGKTYRGEQVRLSTPVCIKHAKYVTPQDELLLNEEAKTMWDLRHYGIPTLRDLMKLDDGSMALVMSYIPGLTLEQVLKETKRLDPEDVCWITERSLNVLKYLHYNGVVHGDVKPQNIIVQPEVHNVCLVDYGLSSIKGVSKSLKANRTKFTFFSSPEQRQKGPIVPESDFYSLGMCMIYSLGGDIETKKVPASTPDPLCIFIRNLVNNDVLLRPSWEKEDLIETLREARYNSFGRKSSGLKKLGELLK